MLIVHGLTNCDSTRAARRELAAAGIPARFRDLRALPPSPDEVRRLAAAAGPGLLNRTSATWRGLDEDTRRRDPAELMAAYPALIKRPLVEDGVRVTVGWGPAIRATWLG